MKKKLLLLTLIVPFIAFAQWSKTSLGNKVVKDSKKSIESKNLYTLDKSLLEEKLNNTPKRLSNLPGNIINMPTVNGIKKFEVWEASNLSPTLQAKFPNIKSYVGIGVNDPNLYIRFSTSSHDLSSMILFPGGSEFIEPYTEDKSIFVVFDSKSNRAKGKLPFECTTPEDLEVLKNVENQIENISKSSTGKFQTYRLALSCTGEYTAYHGGTVESALAAMNTTMTRVNGIFEKDFAINLILIDNNDEVIFVDANSDPYTNPGNINTTQSQLQSYLDNNIGFDNYDIGHIFHRSGGGGSAGCIGCVCESNKGKGYTSPASGGPEGDLFDVDYVAHELGHQLGANHTFSFSYEGTGMQTEPGSGSTIMGYAGITSYNVEQNSDDYFTYKSIYQVENNLKNKPCAINETITNQTPTVNAGEPIYNIPNGTAYILKGSATDPDGDALTYNWEANDSGNSSTTNSNSRVSPTKVQGPNFRSLPSTNEPIRYMPKFDLVLAGTLTSTSEWESVNTKGRTSIFALTVRDNSPEIPQTNTAITRVKTIEEIGPFVVTSPALNDNIDLSTNSINVAWDVAGTDGGDVNTTNVKISLSTDGGATFTELIANTPNDGSETLTLPSGIVAGNTNRIMIEAIDNIYYAVSKNFEFTGIMGVQSASLTSSFNIYPNPNNGSFTLSESTIPSGKVKVSIYNMSGELVHINSFNHTGGKINKTYNVNLPSGVYNVVISSDKSKKSQKLIVN